MKKYAARIMIIFMSTILCSCQPTPQEEIIQEKNISQMESIIAETNPESAEKAPVREVISSSYQDCFPGADECVNIHIDAEVSYPSGNMPVIRVRPHTFTVKEVKKWTEVLFEGNIAYEPQTRMTKSELQNQILQIKKILGDEDALYANYRGDENEIAEAKEFFQSQLSFYESQYNSAPERHEKRKTDWVFKPLLYYSYNLGPMEESPDLLNYNRTECLILESEVNGADVKLTVTNRNENDYQLHSILYENSINYSTQPMDMTEAEAVALVEDTLLRIGENKWKLHSCDSMEGTADQGKKAYWYVMEFVPVSEGIEVLKQNQLSVIVSDDTYDAKYYYESLRVVVSNGCIVLLEYTSPLDVVEVENSNVLVMSLDEIKAIFKNQMQLEFTLGKTARLEPSDSHYEEALAEYTGAEIRVQDIRLGLVRIQVPNASNEFRLVPAWCFWGEEGLNWNDEGIYWMSENEPTLKEYYWRLYQAINAIDGSIINVNLGY